MSKVQIATAIEALIDAKIDAKVTDSSDLTATELTSKLRAVTSAKEWLLLALQQDGE